MILRSLLFVPADSEKKLAKARAVPADALILDLEDSVAPENRGKARALTREFLSKKHAQAVWVRVNALGSQDFIRDIEVVAPLAPAGLVIPKPDGPHALAVIDAHLIRLETEAGLPQGAIKLLPVATETPTAVLSLQDYRSPPPRLAALTWGAEDLAAALGATANREADGTFTEPYRVVRALALIAAKAAGALAIETLHADFRDTDGLARVARRARRDGFSGMLAIHPDQVDTINAAFTPNADELAYARRVVSAFADGAGVASLDGKMLDKPHLIQAEKLIALAETLAKRA
jgi:citrate lyase subunit beta / citryl-CoA lyase